MKALAATLAVGVCLAWTPQAWPWRLVQAALLLHAAWLASRDLLIVRPAPWLIVLAAGVIWPWVQMTVGSTVNAGETHLYRLNWISWLAAYLIAESAWRRDERLRDWMLASAGHFSLALAFVAILQRFTAGGRIFWLFDSGYSTGQMGPWVYDNQYAGFVLLLLPVTLWQARGWTFASPALLVASVFVSGSLAGSVLVSAEAVTVLALRAEPLKRVAAVGVLAAAILVVTGWDTLNAKLERREPLRVRADLTAASLDMARDRPWLGWGLGAWSSAYPAYARFDDGAFDNQAHNDWVQWLAEGGVPFFAVTLLLAVGAAAAGWRTGWALGLLFVLTHSLIEFHFQERPVFGALFFTMAALTRAPERPQRAGAASRPAWPIRRTAQGGGT